MARPGVVRSDNGTNRDNCEFIARPMMQTNAFLGINKYIRRTRVHHGI